MPFTANPSPKITQQGRLYKTNISDAPAYRGREIVSGADSPKLFTGSQSNTPLQRRGSKIFKSENIRDASKLKVTTIAPSQSSDARSKRRNYNYAIVFFNVTLYAISVNLSNPFLAHLIKDLEGGSSEFGYVTGWSSFVQMLGALYIGRLIDVYGPKFGMGLAFASAGLSYACLYLAPSMWGIYMSRTFMFFQQAILASRTYIAVTSHSDTKLLGLIHLFLGVGAMLGPALGSLIALGSDGNFRYVFLAASAFSGLSLASTALLMSSDETEALYTPFTPFSPSKGAELKVPAPNNLRMVVALFRRNRTLSKISLVKTLASLGSIVFQTMASLLVVDKYNLDPASTGAIFSFIGVVMVLSQLALNLIMPKVQSNSFDNRVMFWMLLMAPSFYFVIILKTRLTLRLPVQRLR